MQLSSMLLGMITSMVIVFMSLFLLMTYSKRFNRTVIGWNITQRNLFASMFAMLGVLFGFLITGIFYS